LKKNLIGEPFQKYQGPKKHFQSTEPDLRYQIFFRIWALKEALLKATGGTVMMMKDTDVSEIMQGTFPSCCCAMKHQNIRSSFFIYQFDSGHRHHSVIAAGLREQYLNTGRMGIRDRKPSGHSSRNHHQGGHDPGHQRSAKFPLPVTGNLKKRVFLTLFSLSPLPGMNGRH